MEYYFCVMYNFFVFGSHEVLLHTYVSISLHNTISYKNIFSSNYKEKHRLRFYIVSCIDSIITWEVMQSFNLHNIRGHTCIFCYCDFTIDQHTRCTSETSSAAFATFKMYYESSIILRFILEMSNPLVLWNVKAFSWNRRNAWLHEHQVHYVPWNKNKSQNLNHSPLFLQLPLHNPANTVISREWRRSWSSAHRSDQQCYYLLRCDIYSMFDGNMLHICDSDCQKIHAGCTAKGVICLYQSISHYFSFQFLSLFMFDTLPKFYILFFHSI